MKHAWKRMSSGRYVDLLNLSEDDLDIKDIEVALNYIYRFTGHHKDEEPLTVAQHSVLTKKLAEYYEPEDKELHLACLVHDFAEAYIGDISSPVKWAMGPLYRKFSDPIEELVNKKFFGKDVDPELHDRIKVYDLAALDIERRMLWSSQYGKDKWPTNPLNTGTMADKSVWFYEAKNGPTNLSTMWEELYYE